MKYFIDTEFIEGFKKPIKWLPTIKNFNKPYHSIQLVSIGIVAEDGREYYAISNEFDPRDADDWVVENVLIPIYTECVSGDMRNYAGFSTKNNRGVTWGRGKSNKQIAEEIKDFCHHWNDLDSLVIPTSNRAITIDFYAYYADYDWVVFCSLFGRMIDLPKGFPMYCRDLKQILDEKAMGMSSVEATKISCPSCKHDMYDFLEKTDKTYKIKVLKEHPDYPKQANEHNALADAKWNLRLYEFLKTL